MSRSDRTDLFLGGQLKIRQGRYRAGADPVFLAAAVRATQAQSVLELGAGNGVALLCLGRRVPGLKLTGLERDPATAQLARENAALNHIDATIVDGDLADMPQDLRSQTFDHVIMNPPFFTAGTPSPDDTRRDSRHEQTPLSTWLDVALRRLVPGGELTLIYPADRLPEVIAGVHERLGEIGVRPLAPREGRAAKLVILSGKKGAKGPFRLLSPFILHAGDSHAQDGDDYTDQAARILRNAEAFAD